MFHASSRTPRPRRLTLSLLLALSAPALLAAAAPVAWAGCDSTSPVAGQSVVCSPAAPNPETTPIVIGAGATGVTVTLQPGAQLATSNTSAISVDPAAGAVINNQGSIAASGTADGINANAVVTVNNAASGSIGAAQGNALYLQGGSQVVNDGWIDATTGWGIAFTGTGDSRVVNRGSIGGGSGGIQFGAGNDRLEMQAGTLGSVNQGDGDDSLLVSDGQITGSVQQGKGRDDFVMTGGTIAALQQGDNTDTFHMSGGHIIGAFEDGDRAWMTGGRIGRVNMRLEKNLFDMSGGTVDGNVIAGFDNDTIIISGSADVGGNISVSGGGDSVTITGGTVRGQVLTSTGNDRFTWDGGGTVHGVIDLGPDDDVATLGNLDQDNLGAVPRFDGNTGHDRLLLDNVKAAGVARFANWETIDLGKRTELTFDGDLVLGDSATRTGALTVDDTSTVFAGGGDHAVTALAAGALASVVNAGRIDLTNGGGAGDVFTIRGNYRGDGGGVYLQTVLGADGSASDRLVFDGGDATGTTGIGIVNAGGGGAATLLDGILVVQALNGATTAPDAFALSSSVAAGAYEYFLFKGGVSAGTGQNWYLRSTLVEGPTPAPGGDEATPPPDAGGGLPGTGAPPPTPGARPEIDDRVPIYRLETAAYAVAPLLLREASLASLGTFHERQGEQRLLYNHGTARTAWGRLVGQSSELRWKGDVSPGFDGDVQGLQAGLDLWAGGNEDRRDQLGVFVGRTRAQGKGIGEALGWENVQVGQSRLDDKHVGLYWTRTGSAGGYLDAVAMQSRYDGYSRSSRGLGIGLAGDGTSVSLETGKPLLRLGGSSWWLEPQAQVIWQRISLDDRHDAVSSVDFDSDNAWTGRVGLRLAGDYQLADNGWQPYFKLNYWHGRSGADRIRLGDDVIRNAQRYRALEGGIGVVGRFNRTISAYAVADYTHELGGNRDEKRRVIEGNIGLRADW